MQDYMAQHGLEPGGHTEVIGIRADEAHRASRLRDRKRNVARDIATPLIDAGVRKDDVLRFWAAQPFDLNLPRGYGNCDHCPFVGTKNRVARARFDPAGTLWWAQHEKERGLRVRSHIQHGRNPWPRRKPARTDSRRICRCRMWSVVRRGSSMTLPIRRILELVSEVSAIPVADIIGPGTHSLLRSPALHRLPSGEQGRA